MSDALRYLGEARPDAVRAYFAFLRESGRHLDVRTRDLISVITKVHAQTESGLRQYLGRALRNGASPDEVIDALLVAFPTLGLTRILWAIDIILQMDIPEFRPELLGVEPTWHDAGPLAELPEDAITRVECDGRSLFVARADGRTAVYDSRCPHQVTDIPELALDGAELTCPKHGWRFDIGQGGACVEKGDRPLKRFEHRVEAGRLEVRW